MLLHLLQARVHILREHYSGLHGPGTSSIRQKLCDLLLKWILLCRLLIFNRTIARLLLLRVSGSVGIVVHILIGDN